MDKTSISLAGISRIRQPGRTGIASRPGKTYPVRVRTPAAGRSGENSNPGGPIFHLVFTVVYGLMHGLIYTQAAPLLPAQGWARPALALGLLAQVLAPVVTGRLGLRSGPAALAVYAWMGLAFYLFLGCLVLAALRFWVQPGTHKVLFAVLVVAGLAACAYGLVHARQVEVRCITVTTDRMPPEAAPLRLAVISDLHLYSVEQGARLDRVLPVLEGLDYDVLVSLGDLVEAGFHDQEWARAAARLALVRPRLGKYAVTGNHEFYADSFAGQKVSERFHQAAGFEVLSGRVADVGGKLWLAGVDYHGPNGRAEADMLAALPCQGPQARPVVLLKHVPEVNPASCGLFDLQLSGHSHAGQMWPFTLFVKWRFPYLRGLYDLPCGGHLYVSEGTGTWGPPMRVGTSSEITLVEIAPRVQERP